MNIALFLQKNKIQMVILGIVLVVALVLRIWKIDQYMSFLGDEGRDALIISELVNHGNIPFIGPPTSVGNMYLGPFYYYMMALPMFVSGLNPVSASVMVALIGVGTVFLIFYLGRQWFGFYPAVVGSFLYAISPVSIIYSRSSWNPNPAPFFTLVTILGLWKFHSTKNGLWLILSAFGLGAVIQMHYLALVLIPIVIVAFFWEIGKKGFNYRNFWLGSLLALGVLGFMNSPLMLFDIKHNFVNTRAFWDLLSGKGLVTVEYSDNLFFRIWDIWSNKLLARMMGGSNWIIGWGLGATILVYGWIVFVVKKTKFNFWPYGFLVTWLVIGLGAFLVYKGQVYDHYLGYLNPLPYFIISAGLSLVKTTRSIIISAIVVLVLIIINLFQNPIQYPPNRQLQRTQNVTNFILTETAGKPFNFALLSERNYDDAYEFYMKLANQTPKQLPFENTGVLYVICEDPICLPIGNPKYEIAAFGWSKQDWVKDLEDVKIYKLVPNPDQPKD